MVLKYLYINFQLKCLKSTPNDALGRVLGQEYSRHDVITREDKEFVPLLKPVCMRMYDLRNDWYSEAQIFFARPIVSSLWLLENFWSLESREFTGWWHSGYWPSKPRFLIYFYFLQNLTFLLTLQQCNLQTWVYTQFERYWKLVNS